MGLLSILGATGCVLVGLAMLSVSIRSRSRARRLEQLPSSKAVAVEVPGEPGGPFVDFGSSQESPEALSAEPTLVSRSLELLVDRGRVLISEGSKLKVQKIVGAKREPVGPATTAEGGKIVRQFGFEVAPGTKLWLRGGPSPPPEPTQGAGPYRDGARVLEGECLISGEPIKESVDDGCSVGCAVPFVLGFVGLGTYGALAEQTWCLIALAALLVGLGLAKILEPGKVPAG